VVVGRLISEEASEGRGPEGREAPGVSRSESRRTHEDSARPVLSTVIAVPAIYSVLQKACTVGAESGASEALSASALALYPPKYARLVTILKHRCPSKS
jgi:hypothetical protein